MISPGRQKKTSISLAILFATGSNTERTHRPSHSRHRSSTQSISSRCSGLLESQLSTSTAIPTRRLEENSTGDTKPGSLRFSVARSCWELDTTVHKTRCLIDCSPSKSAISPTSKKRRKSAKAARIKAVCDLSRSRRERRQVRAMLTRWKSQNSTMAIVNSQRKNQLKKKEKADGSTRECPRCQKIMMGLRCACGYELTITERLESDSTMLVRIDDKPAAPSESGEVYVVLESAPAFSPKRMEGRVGIAQI